METLRISNDLFPTRVDIPTEKEELQRLFKKESGIISGGTILQLNWEAGLEKPPHLISIEKIVHLSGIQEVNINNNSYIKIGSTTTIADCCKSEIVKEKATILFEACQKIAAPAVRNRATIGGNICSKIGDSIPALLALNADLEFYNGKETYIISLVKWLRSLESSLFELLTNVYIPIHSQDDESFSFFRKVGRRESFTAAVISVAGYLEKKNGKMVNVRLAVGGGAHVPSRLTKAENELMNARDEEIDWKSFYTSIKDSFSSYTDPFISENYRKKVAANIFLTTLKSNLS